MRYNGQMVPTRTLHFASGFAFVHGLRGLYSKGLKPQQMLFLGLDRRGDVNLDIPAAPHDVDRIRVGHKLSLGAPCCEDVFHLDSLHAVGKDVVVLNGDRRVGRFASLVDVAAWVAWFVQKAGNRSVFFGCTPHQPGSWWIRGDQVVPLHSSGGYVDIVVAKGMGLLARKSVDAHLYFLSLEDTERGALDCWRHIYTSPLGNLLMLERRMTDSRLVLSCQRGLVEVDVSDPGLVRETDRLRVGGGFAVVGRIRDGAFAVTRGTPREWGYDNLKPAKLVGSRGCEFKRLRKLLAKLEQTDW